MIAFARESTYNRKSSCRYSQEHNDMADKLGMMQLLKLLQTLKQ